MKWGASQAMVDAAYILLHAQWTLEDLERLTMEQYQVLQYLYVKHLTRTRDGARDVVEDQAGPAYVRLAKVVTGPPSDVWHQVLPPTWQTFEQFAFGSWWRSPGSSLVFFRDVVPGCVMYRGQAGGPGPGPAVAMNAAALMCHYHYHLQLAALPPRARKRMQDARAEIGVPNVTAFVRNTLPRPELSKYVFDGIANPIRFMQLMLEAGCGRRQHQVLVTRPAVTLRSRDVCRMFEDTGPVLVSNLRYHASLENLRELSYTARCLPRHLDAEPCPSPVRHAAVIVGWRTRRDLYGSGVEDYETGAPPAATTEDEEEDMRDAVLFLLQNPWREKQFYVCDMSYLQQGDALLTTIPPKDSGCAFM